jgi:hypothetical protein
MCGKAVVAVKNVPAAQIASEVRPLSQKRGNLVLFSVKETEEGIEFGFGYANGWKVDRHDMKKECQRIALKHGGDPSKSDAVEVSFLRPQFGHQHFGSTRKNAKRTANMIA